MRLFWYHPPLHYRLFVSLVLTWSLPVYQLQKNKKKIKNEFKFLVCQLASGLYNGKKGEKREEFVCVSVCVVVGLDGRTLWLVELPPEAICHQQLFPKKFTVGVNGRWTLRIYRQRPFEISPTCKFYCRKHMDSCKSYFIAVGDGVVAMTLASWGKRRVDKAHLSPPSFISSIGVTKDRHV